jgi:DnaJ family protein B protein 4
MPNHYDVLGVSREASPEEIKRAYRGLSLKWHPDRNSSPEAQSKFQEIGAAYEIMSDERRRQEYNAELDGFSMGGGGGGGQEVDLNDIINMMFGGGGMPFGPMGGMAEMRFGGPGGPGIHVFHGGMPPGMGGMGGMPGMPPHHLFRQIQKPPPIIKNLEVSFDQAYNGCTLCINVEKWSIKEDMRIHEIEPVYVSIHPGIDNGEIVIMRDCGNTISADLKGDIKFIVKVNPSDMFERSGMDLLHKRTIPLKESLIGFSFEIVHVSGKLLCLNNLKNRTIISPNYKKIIPNLGMMRDGNVGNLIIEFSVAFPETLTDEQTTKLAEIL